MNARDLATARLALQTRRFPALEYGPSAIADPSLDDREQALAAAIEHAALRRWVTLATIIESRLARPWAELEFKLQAVLLAGAAQMLLLERVPDYAVINEAVEWAKRNVRPKAGGLVNAVLRKVAALRSAAEPIAADSVSTAGAEYPRDILPLPDGRAWQLTEPVFADDPVRRLSQQTSHPEALIAHWMAAFGADVTAALARHSIVHPPIIVHRPAPPPPHADPPSTPLENPLLTPHEQSGFHVFTGRGSELAGTLHQHDLIVQDPTSAAPVRAIADRIATNTLPSPRTVIDACAGRGTKTRQLAAALPNAQIIAADVNSERLHELARQFAGSPPHPHGHAPQIKVAAFSDLHAWRGQCDLLLLDVPCSNTGVLARRVEAKHRFTREAIEKVVALQRQIIADTLLLLSERASILYSTCSIEPDENQRQAEWLCRWHRFHIAASAATMPRGQPGDPPTTYTDGGYWALLQRDA